VQCSPLQRMLSIKNLLPVKVCCMQAPFALTLLSECKHLNIGNTQVDRSRQLLLLLDCCPELAKHLISHTLSLTCIQLLQP
jgi:hypothetical protein